MRIVQELAPDYIVLRSFEVDRNRNRNGGPFFETAPRRNPSFIARTATVLRVTAPFETLWGGGHDDRLFPRANMERQ
jgi:hypothetical protein